jgi:hypothetical protein
LRQIAIIKVNRTKEALMKAWAETITEPTLPIFTSNNLSLKKLAKLMGIQHSVLAQIVKRDLRTIERDRASDSVRAEIKPLIYVLKMLFELTNGNTQEIQRWLQEPLIEWRGLSPLDCLIGGKLDALVNLVERIYYADSAGF